MNFSPHSFEITQNASNIIKTHEIGKRHFLTFQPYRHVVETDVDVLTDIS